MKLIGRRSLGLDRVPSLEGKTIGVPVGTAADFMLSRFLNLNGINKGKISIVDVQAPRAVEALLEGKIDAVVTWEPNVMKLQSRLGDDIITWPVQSGQPMYCVLLTSDRWARDHHDLLGRFLASLIKAEDYLVQNNEEAMAIIKNQLDYDEDYIRAIWPEHQFSLRLEQSFITAMEDQARWVVGNNLTNEDQALISCLIFMKILSKQLSRSRLKSSGETYDPFKGILLDLADSCPVHHNSSDCPGLRGQVSGKVENNYGRRDS